MFSCTKWRLCKHTFNAKHSSHCCKPSFEIRTHSHEKIIKYFKDIWFWKRTTWKGIRSRGYAIRSLIYVLEITWSKLYVWYKRPISIDISLSLWPAQTFHTFSSLILAMVRKTYSNTIRLTNRSLIITAHN